jgi:hypothetical protein
MGGTVDDIKYIAMLILRHRVPLKYLNSAVFPAASSFFQFSLLVFPLIFCYPVVIPVPPVVQISVTPQTPVTTPAPVAVQAPVVGSVLVATIWLLYLI